MASNKKQIKVSTPPQDEGQALAKLEKQAKIFNDKWRLAFERLTDVFLILFALVFPLALGAQKYGTLTEFKASFVYVTCGIAAALLLVMFTAYMLIGTKFERSQMFKGFKIRIYEWALIAYLLVNLVSSILSDHQNAVWLGWETRNDGFVILCCYSLIFFLISRGLKPKKIHLYAFSLGVFLVGFIALLQFLGQDIFNLFPYLNADPNYSDGTTPYHGGLSITYRTTLGNIDIVSTFCAVYALFFSILYVESKKPIRFAYLTVSAMTFLTLLIAAADAGKVGVLVCMVLLIPYWISKKERFGKILIVLSSWGISYAWYHGYLASVKQKYESGEMILRKFEENLINGYSPVNLLPWILLSLLAVGVGVLLLHLKPIKWLAQKTAVISGFVLLVVAIGGGLLGVELLGARMSDNPNNVIYQAREVMHGNFHDDFGSARGYIWRIAMEEVPKALAIGTGPDTFGFTVGTAHYDDSIARYSVYFDKAHNEFLQILICSGLIGLLSYLLFFGSLLVTGLKHALNRPWVIAAIAGTAGYLIQSFFGLAVPISYPFLWIMAGVVGACIKRDDKFSNEL